MILLDYKYDVSGRAVLAAATTLGGGLIGVAAVQSGRTVHGQVAIDAAPTEQHEASSQATEHRVEAGSRITDHVEPQPRRFSLEGIISNVPLDVPATQNRGVQGSVQKQTAQTPGGRSIDFSALAFDGTMDRGREVFGDLVDAVLNGALFAVYTSFDTYFDMVCTKFSCPRSAQTGDSLRFSMEFQKIRFVEAQSVKGIPAKQKAVKGPDHKGQKPTEDAKAEDSGFALKAAKKFLGENVLK